MQTNLKRRGDTYYARLRVAGRDYQRSLRTGDLKEAKKRLKAWRDKLERAVVGAEGCPTLKAVTIRWDEEILPKAVKPAVRQRYLCSMRQVVATLGDMPVDMITMRTLADYVSQRGRTATNATIRRDLSALSRLLACCIAWGHCTVNPAKYYDRSLIREKRDPIEPPNPKDVATLIAAAPPAMARILSLLNETGMREEEAVQLEGHQIDWARRQIKLIRTKTNRPRVLDFKQPGGDAAEALAGAPEIGPVFIHSGGNTYQNFASQAHVLVMRLADKDPNFRRFRIHDLRHGFAIRALKNGMNIYELKRYLGHRSLKTTELYIDHLSAAEAAAVVA